MDSDLQRRLLGASQYERARVPVALLFEPPLPERLGRCLTSRWHAYDACAHESSLVRRERCLRKTVAACLARLKSQKRLLAHLALVEADTTQAQATLCVMEECYRVYNEIWEIYLSGLDSGRGDRPWERERGASAPPDQELLSRLRFAAYLRSIGTQAGAVFRAAKEKGDSGRGTQASSGSATNGYKAERT